jgi:hypothetical protein
MELSACKRETNTAWCLATHVRVSRARSDPQQYTIVEGSDQGVTDQTVTLEKKEVEELIVGCRLHLGGNG